MYAQANRLTNKGQKQTKVQKIKKFLPNSLGEL